MVEADLERAEERAEAGEKWVFFKVVTKIPKISLITFLLFNTEFFSLLLFDEKSIINAYSFKLSSSPTFFNQNVRFSKIVELEEELRVVGNNLKSLELSEEKALEREETYGLQKPTYLGVILNFRGTDPPIGHPS